MSMAIPFDTLKFAERLEKAGLSREQACAFSEAQKEALGEVLDSSLPTRADIMHIEKRLETDVIRIENRIETMELRLTIKMGAFMAVAVGVLTAVFKYPF